LPTASYIATQLYSAMPSDIVLAQFKGKYNITETKGFNITFALQKYHSIKDGISLKITCIYYVLESQNKEHPSGCFLFCLQTVHKPTSLRLIQFAKQTRRGTFPSAPGGRYSEEKGVAVTR